MFKVTFVCNEVDLQGIIKFLTYLKVNKYNISLYNEQDKSAEVSINKEEKEDDKIIEEELDVNEMNVFDQIKVLNPNYMRKKQRISGMNVTKALISCLREKDKNEASYAELQAFFLKIGYKAESTNPALSIAVRYGFAEKFEKVIKHYPIRYVKLTALGKVASDADIVNANKNYQYGYRRMVRERRRNEKELEK